MKRKLLVLGMLLLIFESGRVFGAAKMFRCVGADQVPNYSTTTVAGADCKLVFVAPPPGWLWVANMEGGSVYAHMGSVSRANDVVRAWVMYSYTSTQEWNGIQYMSVKEHGAYDCRNPNFPRLVCASHDLGRRQTRS